jgi:2-polyprenyl-3-methyl-5-hydroxy-6-metoxy-1,4-benzoquinol methylase
MLRASLYDFLRQLASPRTRRWVKEQRWFVPVADLLFQNSIYSESYYRDIERIEGQSVENIADWITAWLAPTRAIDVGCGPGHLMASLEKRGVKTFGVDVSEAALRAVHAKGFRAEKFDLRTKQPLPGAPYDLAICCEVAEHLPERFASQLVRHLANASKTIFFTAAEGDIQAGVGLHHVNERPNSYWIALFTECEFELAEDATASARAQLNVPDTVNYLRRPMIFRRA